MPFDSPDDVGRLDHRHAPGQAGHHVQAKLFRPILFIAVTQWNRPGTPASARGTTGEAAYGVDELVVRVGFPLGRLASTGHDHARARLGPVWSRRHRRREVHQTGHWAEHAFGVMDQVDELAQGGLLTPADNSVERRVIMALLANLNELDSIPEMVHDFLVPPEVPPLNGVIVLASGHDEPIGESRSDLFRHGGRPGPFLVGQVDIATKCCGPNVGSQLLIEIVHEPP
jgi:hypothetical protein